MSKDVFLVTGTSGFIGQNLVNYLVKQGKKVVSILLSEELRPVSFLNNDIKMTIYDAPEEIIGKSLDADITFVRGNIIDIDFLERFYAALEKNAFQIDIVVHLAGCSIIQKAIKNKELTWLTNEKGTQNMLQRCQKSQKRLGIKGFIHASTDKVYGEGSRLSYQETDALNPLPYPYDESKAAADKLVRQAFIDKAFPSVVLRFCNVYGPADFHKDRLVPGTIYRIKKQNTPPILKLLKQPDGTARSFCRDMIFIEDLTYAIFLLSQNILNGENTYKIFGQAFNLGSGNCYEIQEIMTLLLNYLNYPNAPQIELIESGEIAEQAMNYQKAFNTFDFKPLFSLSEGLKKTVEWYLENGNKIFDWYE